MLNLENLVLFHEREITKEKSFAYDRIVNKYRQEYETATFAIITAPRADDPEMHVVAVGVLFSDYQGNDMDFYDIVRKNFIPEDELKKYRIPEITEDNVEYVAGADFHNTEIHYLEEGDSGVVSIQDKELNRTFVRAYIESQVLYVTPCEN